MEEFYNGKADLKFKKQVGKLKWTWMGCEQMDCTHWIHAVRAGVKIPCSKKLPLMEYLCPAHKQSTR